MNLYNLNLLVGQVGISFQEHSVARNFGPSFTSLHIGATLFHKFPNSQKLHVDIQHRQLQVTLGSIPTL